MFKSANKELKNTAATLKEEVEALTEKLAASEGQVRTLKEEQAKREDEIFWQLVQQVKQLKGQV